jgi:FkbM family methyltransferase
MSINRNPNKFMIAIKKLVARLLFSTPVGIVLAGLYRNKIPCYDFVVDTRSAFFPARSKASLFFRAYEGAELRFIRKYLKNDYDVVELGASFGVVSSQIASLLKDTDRRLICVEPNEHLIESLKTNLGLNGRFENCYVVNKIIDYENSETSTTAFHPSEDILVSKKIRLENEAQNAVLIERTTLSEIIEEHEVARYSLIMDIEGAEIEIMLNDQDAFKQCTRIIVELHDTTFRGVDYSIEDLIHIVQAKLNFKIVDGYGPVIVFERNEE